jgi:hypothetical protein
MPRAVIASGLAAVAALSLYLTTPTLEYGFVYDDHQNIVERIPAGELGWQDFLSTRHWGLGRHAVLLSYDLDRADPLQPRRFHRTNAILAATVSVLVVLTASGVGLPVLGATIAGLLFAAHPLQADAVASLAGRAELLAAICVLAALCLHVRGYPGGRAARIAAAVLFFIGLASKESAISLLPLLVAYDALLTDSSRRHELRATYIGYAIALAAWVVFVSANFADVSPILHVDNPIAHDPWYVRVPKASYVLGEYLRLALFPATQRLDYSYAVLEPTVATGMVAFTLWALAAVGALVLARRYPLAIFCTVWFPLCFVATGNVAFPIGTIMAERLAFLAVAGPCMLGGLAASRVAGDNRTRIVVALALAAVAVTGLGQRFRERASAWKDDVTYHSRAASESPRSAKAHYNLGLVHARAGDLALAAASFENACEIHPGFRAATIDLVKVQTQRDELARAAATYRDYLDSEPLDTDIIEAVVMLELNVGPHDATLLSAQKLVELDPADIERRLLLSRVEAALANRISP